MTLNWFGSRYIAWSWLHWLRVCFRCVVKSSWIHGCLVCHLVLLFSTWNGCALHNWLDWMKLGVDIHLQVDPKVCNWFFCCICPWLGLMSCNVMSQVLHYDPMAGRLEDHLCTVACHVWRSSISLCCLGLMQEMLAPVRDFADAAGIALPWFGWSMIVFW